MSSIFKCGHFLFRRQPLPQSNKQATVRFSLFWALGGVTIRRRSAAQGRALTRTAKHCVPHRRDSHHCAVLWSPLGRHQKHIAKPPRSRSAAQMSSWQLQHLPSHQHEKPPPIRWKSRRRRLARRAAQLCSRLLRMRTFRTFGRADHGCPTLRRPLDGFLLSAATSRAKTAKNMASASGCSCDRLACRAVESTAAARLPRRQQQPCQHHQQEAQVRPRRQRLLRERRSSRSAVCGLTCPVW